MIPFIRSHTELMAITESRDSKKKDLSQNIESSSPAVDSGERKRYISSLGKKEVGLPALPKTIRHKWLQNKQSISRFIDDLDYNNQIQSSYDLTLLEIQNKNEQRDIA